MTDVHSMSIPSQGEIQHAALEHDIRTAQTHTEMNAAHKRSASQLETYRDELMSKVHAHLAELHQLDETKERTSVFKAEMLAKVDEHMAELGKEEAKKEEVAKIKSELLAKVHRHAEELEQLDAKKADLATYKTELLSRAEEHVKEVEMAHEKEVQVRRFSMEMLEKLKEHEAHIAERAKVAEKLKTEIVKEARSYSTNGGGFEVALGEESTPKF